MTEKKPIFRFVDEFVFKQIDNLKNSQPYLEAIRQMNSLNDFQLKIINQITTLVVVAIPLVIVLIIFFINLSFNSQLDVKRDILTEINSYTNAQKQLQALGRNIISGAGLNNKTEFTRQVTNSISTAGGARTNTRILDFDSKPKDGIIKSSGVVKFSKLSTKVLSNFLTDLVDRNKFRVSNIVVRKNLKDNIVNGQIELQHYGRAPEAKE